MKGREIKTEYAAEEEKWWRKTLKRTKRHAGENKIYKKKIIKRE